MTTKFISAQHENTTQPLPLEKEIVDKKKAHRIWIGNVDPQLNEFSLLQILKQFGKIKEFDFLFHKSGPLQGKSRGFHFATYFAKEDAERAIKTLNGKYLMSKTMLVRWADEHVSDDKSLPINLNLKTDLVKNESFSEDKTKQFSKKDMISSIEQKLKQMEQRQSNEVPSTSTGLHPLLQKSKANAAAEEARKRAQPYHKSFKRKR